VFIAVSGVGVRRDFQRGKSYCWVEAWGRGAPASSDDYMQEYAHPSAYMPVETVYDLP